MPTPAFTGSSNAGSGNNSYTPTPDGIRVAVFNAKLRTRLLCPRLEAGKPPAPIEPCRAVAPSRPCSTTASRTQLFASLGETCHKIQRLMDQEVLQRAWDLAPARGPFRSSVGQDWLDGLRHVSCVSDLDLAGLDLLDHGDGDG